MYWSSHVAVGSVLGLKSRSVSKAFLSGLVSHIAMDLIPHYDFDLLPLQVADFVIGLQIVKFMISSSSSRKNRIFFGALGAGLPDIEGALVLLGLLPENMAIFHRFFPHPSTKLERSLIAEGLLILLCIQRGLQRKKKLPSNPSSFS